MLDVAVYNSRQHAQWRHRSGPLVLARGSGENAIWQRVAVTCPQDSGEFLEILAEGVGVTVRHFSHDGATANSTEFTNSARSREWRLPARLNIGDSLVEIADVAGRRRHAPSELHELLPDGARTETISPRQNVPASETLARWLDALSKIHRSAASSQEFFGQAARFVVDPIGLDGAMILRRRDGEWEIVASHLRDPELGILCDFDVLDQLVDIPKTRFEGSPPGEISSLVRLLGESVTFMLSTIQRRCAVCDLLRHRPCQTSDPHAVVISPLFDVGAELTGAIYGFRTVHRGNSRRRIRHLEARLVDVLAGSVSSGIARLAREAEAARQRALFAQTFAPSVIHELERNPAALHGQERVISILFADLRNFTSLCAALGTAESYQLLNDVMDTLTNAVIDHEGVVIDYYGDGLSAMWNAPLGQPDHPELACRAALAMQQALPEVNQRWRERLPRQLRMGVGVHTGAAQVGNVGSNRRLKYGPRGANVNLASRVEAATKRLRLPVLATCATAARLPNRLMSYRVCQARLPGVPEVVELFAVSYPTTEQRVVAQLERYEQALMLYESGQLAEAEELLSSAPARCEEVPTRFLADHLRSYRRQRRGRRENDRPNRDMGPVIALDVK